MVPAVLLTRRIPSAVLARLEPRAAIDLYEGDAPIGHDELVARIRGKQALICLLTDRIDGEVLDAGRDLKIVANIAVGYDNVDVDAARARGIVVTHTPDVLTEAVAEFTWGLILALARRIPEGDRIVRRGEWTGWALDFLLGSELRGKQLGIIGMGRIGRAVAARAGAFGMHVVYVSEEASGPDPSWKRMPFDEVLVSSDVISIHVPLTPDTHHLFGQRTLARMKRSAFLINTSRGAIVDERALVWALGERLIAGAALDVYEHEPAVASELRSFENVVLAPHLGSATRETRTAMTDLAVRNVLAVFDGHPPLTPVEP